MVWLHWFKSCAYYKINFWPFFLESRGFQDTSHAKVFFKQKISPRKWLPWWSTPYHRGLESPFIQILPWRRQGRAKPDFLTRNRNQWVQLSSFRTTKPKPMCMNYCLRHQNRNQYSNAMQFDTEIVTNVPRYLFRITKSKPIYTLCPVRSRNRNQ